jgi:hypothetical protein
MPARAKMDGFASLAMTVKARHCEEHSHEAIHLSRLGAGDSDLRAQ